jgi:hypothetical protein
MVRHSAPVITAASSTLDRQTSTRHRPGYTPDEIDTLRITRVHVRQDHIFCLLSDGNMLSVPLRIVPALRAAPDRIRDQWQVTADGQSVVWHSGETGNRYIPRLHLARILRHPQAYIAVSR